MIFSWFSCVRTSVILKKIIKFTFILVKRGWIQHEKKLQKKWKHLMRLRFVFFYVIFHENTFFLETGIERRWVKNSFNTGVFLGFVFFWKMKLCFKSLHSNSNWVLKIQEKLQHWKVVMSSPLDGGSLVSFQVLAEIDVHLSKTIICA